MTERSTTLLAWKIWLVLCGILEIDFQDTLRNHFRIPSLVTGHRSLVHCPWSLVEGPWPLVLCTNAGPKSALFLELGRRTLCPSARVVCRLIFVDPGLFLSRPKSEAHPVRARKSAQAPTSNVWASRSFCVSLHQALSKNSARTGCANDSGSSS